LPERGADPRAVDRAHGAAPLQCLVHIATLGAPWLMRALSVAGTIAMFLVGGGILSHGIPGAQRRVEHWSQAAAGISGSGGLLSALLPTLINLLVGLIAGSIALALVMLMKRVRGSAQAPSQ
jgi:predicted DNA repair protein MutK